MPTTKKRKRRISAKRREELIAKLAEKLGGEWLDPDFVTETFNTDLEDYYGLSRMSVSWQLGYCQGDGVEITGTIDLSELRSWPPKGKDCKPEWRERYQELDGLMKNMEAIAVLLGCDVDDCNYYSPTIKNSHLYERQILRGSIDYVPALVECESKVLEWLEDYVADVVGELESNGYAMIEYEGSIERATEEFDRDPDHWIDTL